MGIQKQNGLSIFENPVNHPSAGKNSFKSTKYLLKFSYQRLSKGYRSETELKKVSIPVSASLRPRQKFPLNKIVNHSYAGMVSIKIH